MPIIWFQVGCRLVQTGCVNILTTKLIPWVQKNFPDGAVVLQQDRAPARTSNKTQNFLHNHCHILQFWTKTRWPPYSQDANPLDYAFSPHIEGEACRRCHSNIATLKASKNHFMTFMVTISMLVVVATLEAEAIHSAECSVLKKFCVVWLKVGLVACIMSTTPNILWSHLLSYWNSQCLSNAGTKGVQQRLCQSLNHSQYPWLIRKEACLLMVGMNVMGLPLITLLTSLKVLGTSMAWVTTTTQAWWVLPLYCLWNDFCFFFHDGIARHSDDEGGTIRPTFSFH